MSSIVERLKALVNGGTELPFEDIMIVEQAIAEIARLQAELSAARDNAAESITWRTDDLNAQLAYARAEALEEAARYHDHKAQYIADLAAHNKHHHVLYDKLTTDVITHQRHAAAIRRLKEGATPGPVPSLAKLFDDIAAKQRSINDQFEEFMSDVEEKP